MAGKERGGTRRQEGYVYGVRPSFSLDVIGLWLMSRSSSASLRWPSWCTESDGASCMIDRRPIGRFQGDEMIGERKRYLEAMAATLEKVWRCRSTTPDQGT